MTAERKTRTVRKAEIVVEAANDDGHQQHIKGGFKSTADAQKWLREATDLPKADEYRIIAVKWRGSITVEKIEKRKLT